ncbi:MAG: PQQ-binding-like beta-propeller repeat protein [Myxococcales bacterium]|nr:PQQ-binding-like beta-propeller repeat protein [Myxococcales bacterium]
MYKEHAPIPLNVPLTAPTTDHAGQAASQPASDPWTTLRQLMVGDSRLPDELPSLPDLIAGVSALAEARRQRVTIPLGGMPAEFTLSREADHVRIDCYRTETTPEVLIRGRRVRLRTLLEGCAMAGLAAGYAAKSATMGGAMVRLSQRLSGLPVAPVASQSPAVACTGGSLDAPEHVRLAFGFRAEIAPPAGEVRGSHGFSDLHAMLFDGELWAFASGRRFMLDRGPILLSAQRMTDAVRAMLDAWQAGRDVHVRLRAEAFSVALRLEDNVVDLELTGAQSGPVILRDLGVREAALPILRIASDMLRRLVGVDRTQLHNLRVTALRHEVRELRRIVRLRERNDGFQNQDPERLRLAQAQAVSTAEDTTTGVVPTRLRYTERWRAEVDGLDASSIFVAGQRLVVATPKLTLALCRDRGNVLWSQPSGQSSSFMVGRVLLRLQDSGEVDLTDVETGQVRARARIAARVGTPKAMFAGGNGLPPIAILTEGHKRLVAIDLRTGELRWRMRCRGAGSVQMHRAGRVLVVTSGDGSLDAVDIGTGEVVWRFCDSVCFTLPVAVAGETVVAASGEPGGGTGSLYGVELFSGKCLWQQRLPAAPSAAPISTSQGAVVAFGGGRQARLSAIDPDTGDKRWVCRDPGLDHGGHGLEVDHALIVNTPRGRIACIDLETGETRWSQALSNPLVDDVPRQLRPRLRQGALFTPSAQVHVLRPSDGSALTQNMHCDLVPDFLEVDERGWLYVAEESGHLRAYGSAALSLVAPL